MSRPVVKTQEGLLGAHERRITLLERRLARTPSGLPERLGPAGAEVTDWNDAILPGFYWGLTTATNGPLTGLEFIGTVSIKPSPSTGIQRVVQDLTYPTTDPARNVMTFRRVLNIATGTWTAWRLVEGKGYGPTSERTQITPNYLDEWYDSTDGFVYIGSKTGTWRRKSGTGSSAATAWDSTGSSGTVINAARTFSATIPTVLETSETLTLTLISGGSGFTFLSMNTLTRNPTNTSITCRYGQLFSTTTQACTFVWTVTPI